MLIGLSGHARVGKDAVAKILGEKHEFTRIAFADQVRLMCERINPWTLTDDWPRATPLKSLVEHRGWEEAKQYEDVRRYLQSVGMAAREVIGPEVWIDSLFRFAHHLTGDLVISDVRFPNEVRAVEERGGVVWRITRPGFGPINDHESETALDDWKFAVTIDNTLGLDWLEGRVGRALWDSRNIIDEEGAA